MEVLELGIKQYELNKNIKKIRLKTENRDIVISTEDVLLIEAINKKSYFYTKDVEGYLNSSLETCEDLSLLFIRINKSQIVNIKMIERITPTFNMKIILLLKDDSTVEVNRRYKKDFDNHLKKWEELL